MAVGDETQQPLVGSSDGSDDNPSKPFYKFDDDQQMTQAFLKKGKKWESFTSFESLGYFWQLKH